MNEREMDRFVALLAGDQPAADDPPRVVQVALALRTEMLLRKHDQQLEALLPDEDAPGSRVPSALPDAGTLASVGGSHEATNDARWTEHPLTLLAAATGDDGEGPLRLAPAGDSARDFTLVRSFSKARQQTLLVFEAAADAIGRYAGHELRLMVGPRVIELGVVDAQGQGRITVPGPVPLLGAVLSTRPLDPRA